MVSIKSVGKEPQSLRKVVTGALVVTFVFFIIVFMTAFYLNMTNMLKRVESEHTAELGAIVRGTLAANLGDMRSSTRLWSSNDSLYNYARTNRQYLLSQSLKTGVGLTVSDVDYVIIKDLNGNDLFTGSRSDGEAGEPPAGMSERISEIAADVLSRPVAAASDITYEGQYCDTGFIVVDGTSYMVCVAPILPFDENAAPSGTFTLVKEFDDKKFTAFTQMENGRFSITELSAQDRFRETFIVVENKDVISLVTYVKNLGNDRGAVLRIDTPRTLYNTGMRIIIFISFVVWLLLLGVMAVLYMVLDRYLLRPIAKLKTDLAKVSQNETLNTEEYVQYLELHMLAHTINDAIHRLRQSHQRARQSEISLGTVTGILNGIDAFIYVTNPETNEVLFMNERMKTHYKISGNPVGQICWRILHIGKTEACDFCPCPELEEKPGQVYVWERYSEITGRMHRNTDAVIEWTGGSKAHLHHIIDVTDEKKAEESLKRQLSQQALMSELSQTFLVVDGLDSQISRALKITGEFMDVGRVLLCSFDEQRGSFTGQNEWLAPEVGLVSYLGKTAKIDERDLFMISSMKNRRVSVVNSDKTIGMFSGKYGDMETYLIAPIYVANSLWGILDVRGSKSGKWTESDVALVRLAAGIISVSLDRRIKEDELRSMSSIVHYSPHFICYVNQEAELTYVNPAVMEATGYEEKELMEKGFRTLFDDKMFARIQGELLPKTLANGTCQFEVEMLHKNGNTRIFAISAFIVGDGSGYVGAIARDITETRRLALELVAAKELAEQGSRAKGEFLSRMSHEMRTPMNAIIGMTNIAKSSGDIKKKEYCLEKIETASMHLLGVINDVLDMSKIEADKFELSPAEFSFDHMLNDIINVISFRMEERLQNLSLTVDPAIPSRLIGDEQRLKQVLLNLLTNAIKFTPENGHVGLVFKLLGVYSGDLHLEIEVSDSGIGISHEQQARLFRSFEQADNSIARKYGGTGLGLVISRRIVQLMGGDIRIESELEKGSKFIFDIRAKRGSEGTLETVKRKFAGQDLDILMVDDSQETREYFQYVMDSFNIPCRTACDGIDAMQIIKSAKNPFDLIFVDWKMPNMNGVELTKQIRRLKESDPVVVMISVAEWSDIEKEAVLAGVDGFIPKPLFPSMIMDCVNKYVGKRSEHKPAELPKPVDNHDEDAMPSFAGKVALLAEDVDINREIAVTILEETQIEIDCAENGLEAVRMFEQNPDRYDVIMMDVHMPEVDGLEATRRIRAMDCAGAKRVPIIAMTANVFRGDVEECLNAGMDDHVGKPIDFNELLTKLGKHLS